MKRPASHDNESGIRCSEASQRILGPLVERDNGLDDSNIARYQIVVAVTIINWLACR